MTSKDTGRINKKRKERSLESKKELMDNKQDRIVIHERKQGRVKE